jgi:uncharacterized protein with HEPN domain
MASKNPLIRLGHIRTEIESITSRLIEVDRQTFIQDYLLLRAGERALLIISEAAKSLPRELTAGYPEVDWRAVCGLGDVLRHDYNRVDPDVIWEILVGKLPELAPTIERMIRDVSSETP